MDLDLDLDNVFEVIQIRQLISHDKKLIEFFDELIKVKNMIIVDSESYDSDSDFGEDDDSD